MPADYTDYVTSYHVHSCVSDGEAEIVEYIIAAGQMGLDEIGLSDHYVLFPDRRKLDWNMHVDGLDDYVEAVQSAAGEADETLIVRLGIEADYIPETTDELRNLLSFQPFDYIIGSVHFVDGFAIDADTRDWAKLSQAEVDEINRVYWIRIAEMARTGIYDIAGHLELTKKFGFYPSIDMSEEIGRALDAIAEVGMAVELNTSGWYMPACEQYPSVPILKGCLARGIPLMVNADAHKPENLARGFEDAYILLREIGFREVASYAGRGRSMRSL